ncbi:hypothetical protein M9H77_25817 [Catharanthus roseus]|uniref:Uncharacterized protein n=1 Tax=Catharanthus roseus TaxID=4058 RepID=A0ACC0A880_CATRO|nr:hypothetical protein M9H77_25817 [Catharanthus roseus]
MTWTVSDSGGWIHLRKSIIPWRVWPKRYYVRHCIMLCDGTAALWRVRMDLKLRCLADTDYEMSELVFDDLVMGSGLCLWCTTFALHVLLNSGVEAALLCLDSFSLPSSLTQIEQWRSQPLKFYAWSFWIGSFSEERVNKVNVKSFKIFKGLSLSNFIRYPSSLSFKTFKEKVKVKNEFFLGKLLDSHVNFSNPYMTI